MTNLLKKLADPTRFERAAFAFGGRRSIQLSYGSITPHKGVAAPYSGIPRKAQSPSHGHRRVRSASCCGVNTAGPSATPSGWSGRVAGSVQQFTTPRLREQNTGGCGFGSTGRQYVLPCSSRTAEQSLPLTKEITASTGVRPMAATLPAAVPTTAVAIISGGAPHPAKGAQSGTQISQRTFFIPPA